MIFMWFNERRLDVPFLILIPFPDQEIAAEPRWNCDKTGAINPSTRSRACFEILLIIFWHWATFCGDSPLVINAKAFLEVMVLCKMTGNLGAKCCAKLLWFGDCLVNWSTALQGISDRSRTKGAVTGSTGVEHFVSVNFTWRYGFWPFLFRTCTLVGGTLGFLIFLLFILFGHLVHVSVVSWLFMGQGDFLCEWRREPGIGRSILWSERPAALRGVWAGTLVWRKYWDIAIVWLFPISYT